MSINERAFLPLSFLFRVFLSPTASALISGTIHKVLLIASSSRHSFSPFATPSWMLFPLAVASIAAASSFSFVTNDK